ncbi:calcineurin subunit B type 1-like isoform X2 [Trifolium pratense]|uniref:Uncharacterized protein n=1 Tax=Trifolium pratense TaxID=57577 RepID=A0ACB0JXM8_TRIPR|nr:calcineurin subunit B type 1-like isoform X2 [Trifolium pratense]CAJ2649616.1 unnamed protein product [Trifolium pratense]
MGNTSSMLTQYDIEEVQQHCKNAFTQQEIVSLYQRFCQLDRNNCGFIPSDEFLSIPEFAVNPLSQIIFKVYDTDCNGKVSFDDMLTVLRDLTGQYMSEQQRKEVLAQVLEEAGYTKDSFLVLSDFMKILGNSDLKMEAEVPVD